MNELLTTLESHGLQTFFGLVLLASVLVVLLLNGRGLRAVSDSFQPAEGESEIDRLSVRTLFGASLLIVTTKRVVVEKRWLLLSHASRKFFPLEDVHSVRTWSGLNLLLVALAVYSLAWPVPVTLVAWMVALESTVAWVGLMVAWNRAPFGRAGLLSLRRSRHADIQRFYDSLRSALAGVRSGSAGGADSTRSASAGSRFAWGRAVWGSTLLVLLTAIAQRLTFGHVGYDEPWLAPVLLGAPVAAAALSVRDGLWAALLGWVAVYGVKFPAAQWSDGSVHGIQAGFVLLGVLVIGVLAGVLARAVSRAVAPLALLAWFAVVASDDLAAALDLRVAVIVTAAMAIAGLFSLAYSQGSEAASTDAAAPAAELPRPATESSP